MQDTTQTQDTPAQIRNKRIARVFSAISTASILAIFALLTTSVVFINTLPAFALGLIFAIPALFMLGASIFNFLSERGKSAEAKNEAKIITDRLALIAMLGAIAAILVDKLVVAKELLMGIHLLGAAAILPFLPALLFISALVIKASYHIWRIIKKGEKDPDAMALKDSLRSHVISLLTLGISAILITVAIFMGIAPLALAGIGLAAMGTVFSVVKPFVGKTTPSIPPQKSVSTVSPDIKKEPTDELLPNITDTNQLVTSGKNTALHNADSEMRSLLTPQAPAPSPSHVATVSASLLAGDMGKLLHTENIAPAASIPAYRPTEADLQALEQAKKSMARWEAKKYDIKNKINADDDKGFTPLLYASLRGHTATAEYLLNHGADITVLDDYDRTPLHLAALSGNLSTMQLLIAHGADVNAEAERQGHATPLILYQESCGDKGVKQKPEILKLLAPQSSDNEEDDDREDDGEAPLADHPPTPTH